MRLHTITYMAKKSLPVDFHDRLEKREDVSREQYFERVKRYNQLCQELNIQFLWSVIRVGGTLRYTTTTSEDWVLNEARDYRFWDEVEFPELYQTALETMTPTAREFSNPYGSGRLYLVPYRNSKGQTFVFGVSIAATEVNEILKHSLYKHIKFAAFSLFVGFVLLVLGIYLGNNLLNKTFQTEQIHRTLNRLESIIHAGGWSFNVKTNTLFWTPQTYKLHELPESTPITVERAIGFYLPEDQKRIRHYYETCLTKKVAFDDYFVIKTNKGNTLKVRATGQARINKDGEVTDLYGIFQDATELLNSLEEKQLLLRELEHRTKNNFQIILGLLSFEKTKAKQKKIPETLQSLEKISSQIFVLATIHDLLYSDFKATLPNLRIHLEKIASHFLENSSAFKIHISPFNLPTTISASATQALYLGLIFNELLTNSSKHNGTKELQIEWGAFENEHQVHFVYFDNGAFYQNPNSESEQTDTITGGTSLNRLFAEKLKGHTQHVSIETLPQPIRDFISEKLTSKTNPQYAYHLTFRKENHHDS